MVHLKYSVTMQKARGLMVKYIVKNKINTVQNLMHFKEGDYRLDVVNSSENRLKFIR